MAITKTTTLAFCIESGLKEALRIVAEQERGPIANRGEMLVWDCGWRNGSNLPATSPYRTKK